MSSNFIDFHTNQSFTKHKLGSILNMSPAAQLSQVVNMNNKSLKKLYKPSVKSFAQGNNMIKLDLQLSNKNITDFAVPTWSHFLQQ